MNGEKQIEEMAKHIPVRMFTHNKISNCVEFDEYHRKLIAEFLLRAGYRKASDIAREIFEEIEKYTVTLGMRDGSYYRQFTGISKEILAELKKKYTEGGK